MSVIEITKIEQERGCNAGECRKDSRYRLQIGEHLTFLCPEHLLELSNKLILIHLIYPPEEV